MRSRDADVVRRGALLAAIPPMWGTWGMQTGQRDWRLQAADERQRPGRLAATPGTWKGPATRCRGGPGHACGVHATGLHESLGHKGSKMQ